MMANPKRLRSAEEDEWKVDRISLLPDELLVSVLCFLSLKEATATSTLCRRWRNLHTWTHNLDFDGTKLLRKRSKFDKPSLDKERCNFMKWVDHVISKHKSPTLDEFRVLFNLDRTNSRTIDKWLRFALSKRVEKLKLNLTDEGTDGRNYDKDYIFPYGHCVDDFKFLKKLSTNCVNVSGEFVKELLRNCPLLQHLSISQSGELSSLEIIEPFPSFEILEISACGNLKSLVIRNSNIVNLKVINRRIRHVVLEDVPLLAEFWSWLDAPILSMRGIRRMFWSVLPQLRVLKLNAIISGFKEEDIRKFCSGVELSNLRQLVVVDNGSHGESLPHLIKLINVSPRLERFVVESPECYKIPRENPTQDMEMDGEIPKKYPCLKEMKIVGYCGSSFEFKIVKHFVENGVALENIVVDPRALYFELGNWLGYLPQQAIAKLERLAMAYQLRKYVPSRINLTIL